MRSPRHHGARSRDQLLHLLSEASEFEHNLLCCYLYAAFSLKRGADEGLSAPETAAVSRWRESIMAVAIEEMTHLALVANLTVAIGARPHFNRPNLPVAPGYHPAGIVIELAPFDMDTLDHFIFLERPQGSALPDGEGFERETHYDRGAQAGAALMPAADDYSTVADFYETIRAGFVDVAGRIGEARLFSGDAAMQLGPDIAELRGLETITDLRSALAALDTIVIQGEGSSTATEHSHFDRFVSIKEEYEALVARNARFEPARPVARNPVMRAPVEPDGRVHVDHPEAAAALDLANAVYNQMLRLLGQVYARANSTRDAKRALLDAAMRLMGILRAVSEHLSTLPASRKTPGVNAGVSFAMFRATEPLCETAGEWAAIGERFEELAAGARAACSGAPHLEPTWHKLDQLARSFSKTVS